VDVPDTTTDNGPDPSTDPTPDTDPTPNTDETPTETPGTSLPSSTTAGALAAVGGVGGAGVIGVGGTALLAGATLGGIRMLQNRKDKKAGQAMFDEASKIGSYDNRELLSKGYPNKVVRLKDAATNLANSQNLLRDSMLPAGGDGQKEKVNEGDKNQAQLAYDVARDKVLLKKEKSALVTTEAETGWKSKFSNALGRRSKNTQDRAAETVNAKLWTNELKGVERTGVNGKDAAPVKMEKNTKDLVRTARKEIARQQKEAELKVKTGREQKIG
jgi:hypothetical protein